MATEAQIRAAVKHNQSKGAIMLRIPRDKDEAIRQAAERAGVSLTAYILKAIEDRMNKEQP